MPRRLVALAVVCGVLDMLANVLYLIATWYGPISIVVTLSSLYPASTVLLARILLGERLTPLQVIGVGCALVAVVLIVQA
jgi:drug/metabolite transporter (DMT)-like permease